MLRPDHDDYVVRKQAEQKIAHDRRGHDREWFLGKQVMVRNLRPGAEWVTDTIVECLESGPVV